MSTKTPAIQICIENYINGNLTTAKEQAKRFSPDRLITYLHIDLGWEVHKSMQTANYLKGKITFQELCDAE